MHSFSSISIYKILTTACCSLVLIACGGGGGGGDNTGSATSAIYNAESYVDNERDDSTLAGVWMLVEESTLQFDLDDFSASEGFFTLDYNRRGLVFLVETVIEPGSPNIVALHCMDNELLSIEPANVLAGTVTFQIEGFNFEGSIINNNRIEGNLSGFSEGVEMLASTITLIKIIDLSQIPPTPPLLDISIQSNSQSISLPDLAPVCFEQTTFNGESFINNQLVKVSGESLYLHALFDANNDGTTFIDEGADISLLNIDADDITVRSLEVNTPTSMFLEDENATINITTSSLTTITGSASATDINGQTATISFDFNFNFN